MRWPIFLLLLLVVVGLCISKNDGYQTYATTVINSEQPNDPYLEWLLKGYGYEGKRVVDPDYNLKESTRLKTMLSNNNYDIKSQWAVEKNPLLYNPYTTRELADGQACLKDDDCYSKRCVYSRCKSDDNVPVGWSPPNTAVSVAYNIVKYVTIFALSFVIFALIFFGGEGGGAKSPRSAKA
jgi:hypothetical protein